MVNKYFLDERLCKSLRDSINASPIFCCDEKYRDMFNVTCAVMDRIDTCVRYLNDHSEYPKTEEDLLCFLMFACMLRDGVEELLKNTVYNGKKHESTEKVYFKKCCQSAPFYFSEDECPTDDEFFEYFRAISFAHPYSTDRNKKIKDRMGKQVSPWVSVVSISCESTNIYKPVGVYVYSGKKDQTGNDAHFIRFSFDDLIGYIQSKYERITEAIDWVNQTIEDRINEWKTDRIDCSKTTIEILEQIRVINLRRFRSPNSIEEMIRYLQQPLSDNSNEMAVEKYRNYLISRIPDLCEAVDAVDFEKQCEIEDEMLSFTPPKIHGGWHYQLEKIFSYLIEEDPGDILWGRLQAKEFQEEFAHKWVNIDADQMGFTEIRLLVTVACFLEKQEQEGKNHA